MFHDHPTPDYRPTPNYLQWLSSGQLGSRLHRAVRLWVIVQGLYGAEAGWSPGLPQPFAYGDVRDRLYAPGHPLDDHLKAEQICDRCRGRQCLCRRSLRHILQPALPPQSLDDWVAAAAQITPYSVAELTAQLDTCPFATVPRSLRDDLKHLSHHGWIRPVGRGKYESLPPSQRPAPAGLPGASADSLGLTPDQQWDVIRALESVAFAQPSLEPIIQQLWQQLWEQRSAPLRRSPLASPTPVQRIFIDIDYILTEATRDRVDTLQSQIEALWQTADGGVIQFDYWHAREQRLSHPTVYPVCLHYTRRAKYLSAYGLDPSGIVTWHNYRLDRIRSQRLRVLAWGDPAVPTELKARRNTGRLPLPEAVQTALMEAWGFNFYLPKVRLILRFDPLFAQEYVDQTQRHPTFKAIAFADLADQIQQDVGDRPEQEQLLQILQHQPPHDAYYCAWIRQGDTNVIHRLRQWRPNGEVIAPLSLRQRMRSEAQRELDFYG